MAAAPRRAWLGSQPLDRGPHHRPAEDYFPLTVRAALGEEFAGLARLLIGGVLLSLWKTRNQAADTGRDTPADQA